jgi:hypothetical protein
LPDDYLPHWKSFDDVSSVLKQAALNPSFVIVKNRAIFRYQPPHFRQAFSLPGDIFGVRHAIIVILIAIHQSGISPLALTAIFHPVASGVFEIIRRRSDDQINRFIGHFLHDLNAITASYFIQETLREAHACLSQINFFEFPRLDF